MPDAHHRPDAHDRPDQADGKPRADARAESVVEIVEARPPRPRPGPGTAIVRPSPRPLPARRRPSPGVVRAAPEVARVAAVSAFHVASWTIGAAVAGAGYVARRAADGESATTILQDAAADLRGVAWRALGLRDDLMAERLPADRPQPEAQTPGDLQRRGSDLLRRSNDVHVVEDTHPAFARILSEITPDEARILRFLFLEGAQPAIDVRTFRPFGIGSELIAAGLNMISEHAGCRNLDRTNQYLTNLARLGLLVFSKEPVGNPQRYQVVEAQPKVADAMKRAGRLPKTVHRSVHLTDFGAEFVQTCLPLNGKVVPHRTLSSG